MARTGRPANVATLRKNQFNLVLDDRTKQLLDEIRESLREQFPMMSNSDIFRAAIRNYHELLGLRQS